MQTTHHFPPSPMSCLKLRRRPGSPDRRDPVPALRLASSHAGPPPSRPPHRPQAPRPCSRESEARRNWGRPRGPVSHRRPSASSAPGSVGHLQQLVAQRNRLGQVDADRSLGVLAQAPCAYRVGNLGGRLSVSLHAVNRTATYSIRLWSWEATPKLSCCFRRRCSSGLCCSGSGSTSRWRALPTGLLTPTSTPRTGRRCSTASRCCWSLPSSS